MKHDGVSVAAMMVLASFVIDRIKAGALFVLAGLNYWQKKFPEPATLKDHKKRAHAVRAQKTVEFCAAGALALAIILIFPDLRFLKALGSNAGVITDFAFTWLALTAGADQLGDLLKGNSKSEQADPKPLQITGDLRLIGEETRGTGKLTSLGNAAGFD